MKRSNRSVRRGLVRFDVRLAPANEILKLAAGRIEGIVQRHLYILVTAGGRRIAADSDISRAGKQATWLYFRSLWRFRAFLK